VSTYWKMWLTLLYHYSVVYWLWYSLVPKCCRTALQALEASNDEEVILLAANTAAATVVDAAVATSLNR
jgi:hypothetical protein